MNYIILLLNKIGLPQQYVETVATLTAILLFILLLYFIWYFSRIISKAYINSKYFKLRSKKWVYAIREANIFSVIVYVPGTRWKDDSRQKKDHRSLPLQSLYGF